jgi:uncharacterized membrane protein YedE/YeeE
MQAADSREKPFWNPYLAGIVLGLVLLATFLIMGNGLGASGAANRLAVAAVDKVAPQHAAATPKMRSLKSKRHGILDNWFIFELLGVFLGGIIGAYTGGRLKRGHVIRGPRISVRSRLFLAVFGGVLMGFAARLARGCTSGQALSGGALLSVGSWAFMLAVFAGGYALALVVRRQWQ